MERKLATIQEIINISPIDGADMIEVATVLGWEVVVAKKDNFKVGDKVIYIEVDSVMPEEPQYDFLRSRNFRVRTIKLKGQVSQGLILPLPLKYVRAAIGYDVTEDMGITKYLTPSEKAEIQNQERAMATDKNRLRKFMMKYSWFHRLFLSRHAKDGFPYWVSKTDEERIQNIPHVLEQFKDNEVYVTEKIDYQSVTFTGKMVLNTTPIIGKLLPKKYKFVVCSRNLINNSHTSLYHRIAKKYNIEEILRINPTLTIQGEQGDTSVQGNKYGIKETKLWVFNIIDHEKKYQYNYAEMDLFCKEWGLTPVPILKVCTLKSLGTSVQELVEQSKGKSVLANIHREGIVIRCIKNGKKILSFKVINPDFLLKYEN